MVLRLICKRQIGTNYKELKEDLKRALVFDKEIEDVVKDFMNGSNFEHKKFVAIKLLENDSFGEWQGGEEKDGVITIPYVSYTATVMEFIHELHDFAKKNSQYDMHNYQDVLDKSGIKDGKDVQECDIDNADAQTILCMIMKIVRADRFVEGTLMHHLQDGYFSKWLKRLKEIDNEDALSGSSA